MKRKIKILLVEDNPEFRNVIDLALKREKTFEPVSMVGTAERALRSLKDIHPHEAPDVLLLDLNLPGISGIEALPQFRSLIPDTKIIILTQSNREADVVDAISRGASGYLLKSSGIKPIKDGIRTVMEGGASLDSHVAQYLLKKLRPGESNAVEESLLTEREIEVLQHLADGLVKKEIAEALNISAFTVATHVRHIYEKLEVPNAPAAVSKAYRSGILSSGEMK